MDGVRKGGNLQKDVCPSLGPAAQAGSFLSIAEKYTRLTLLPRILPAGRNLGQITEIKLTGKLDCRIIQICFYFEFVQTLLSIFCDLKMFRFRFFIALGEKSCRELAMVQTQVYYCLSL